MKEKRIKVNTILVRAICEKCGGEMFPNGNVLTTYPPRYSHTCNLCGNIECFDERYPKQEFEEINYEKN